MKEIKIYKSPWIAIKLILLCSIFVGLGLWGIMFTNIPSWINWLSICFFGLGYPVALYNLFDRRPQIIINEIGIFDQMNNKEYINWEIIQNAYLIDVYEQKFICLVVDERFKPSKNKSKLYQQVVKLNEAIGAQELNISLSQLKIDPEKLTEFILLMKSVAKSNDSELLAKTLAEWAS